MTNIRSHPEISSTAIELGILSTRSEIEGQLDPAARKSLGQVMTPWPVASFMASLLPFDRDDLRLLDPGAGVGTLAAAVIDRALRHDARPRRISVLAYEVDEIMRKGLEVNLRLCADIAAEGDIDVSWEIADSDFVLDAALFSPGTGRPYWRGCADAVIMNPPYRKINVGSEHRNAAAVIGVETTNLYAAFVAAGLTALRPSGHLVAITPRSFCNGSYFRPFRSFMLDHAALRRMHVFASRGRTFRDSAVLQETIITQFQAAATQSDVVITEADEPIAGVCATPTRFSSVVHPDDDDRFIRTPSTEAEIALAERMATMPATLSDLGLTVSTGRVVDFRATEYLSLTADGATVPLLYASHFKHGEVVWPLGWTDKPERIRSVPETASLLVPEGDYVVVKRFTAKEERRRVVATCVRKGALDAQVVGFENHLNYFHISGQPLDAVVAVGLTAYLNTTFVDEYFRTFSGHTQVNATDLKSLRYPTITELHRLGIVIGEATANAGLVDEALALVAFRKDSQSRNPDDRDQESPPS